MQWCDKLSGREINILFICLFGEERSKFMAYLGKEISKEYGLRRINVIHGQPYEAKKLLKKKTYDFVVVTTDAYEDFQKVLEEEKVQVKVKIVDDDCIQNKNCIRKLIIETLQELNLIQK